MSRIKRYLLIFFIIAPISAFTQADSTILKKAELRLQKKFEALSIPKTDSEQNAINDSIVNGFKEILHVPLSYIYPFDSLKNMGKTKSDDETVRFYTWNIPYRDGSQFISGIVQYKLEKDSFGFIILNDKSAELEKSENATLTPKNWFGALYYDIIEEKVNKKRYYFLLGYNPHDLFSNKKIIDVFYFDEYGYPVFGAPFFKLDNKLQKRFILEYNEKASITLHYNKKLKMIVFHHLVPIDHKFKGNPAFYGPDFTFDGFKFDDDVWNLMETIDVRNEY